MLDLFVRDANLGGKIPAIVGTATGQDLATTKDWQTSWETPFAHDLPNKVALRRTDDGELLGLMSYELYDKALAVEVIYMESARTPRADTSGTMELRKPYSPMRYKYPWMRGLMAFWFSKRKPVICWIIMRERSAHDGLQCITRFG